MNLDNRLMPGRERMDREFTDAELLARHLVPAGSTIAFLAAHRVEVSERPHRVNRRSG